MGVKVAIAELWIDPIAETVPVNSVVITFGDGSTTLLGPGTVKKVIDKGHFTVEFRFKKKP